MNNNPINLTVRFLLELAALASVGAWGWQKYEGGLSILLVVLLPVLFAVIWGVFRVEGDPRTAPVAVNGITRLLIECCLFGIALWMLRDTGSVKTSHIFLAVLVIHYGVSYDRILWLIREKSFH